MPLLRQFFRRVSVALAMAALSSPHSQAISFSDIEKDAAKSSGASGEGASGAGGSWGSDFVSNLDEMDKASDFAEKHRAQAAQTSGDYAHMSDEDFEKAWEAHVKADAAPPAKPAALMVSEEDLRDSSWTYNDYFRLHSQVNAEAGVGSDMTREDMIKRMDELSTIDMGQAVGGKAAYTSILWTNNETDQAFRRDDTFFKSLLLSKFPPAPQGCTETNWGSGYFDGLSGVKFLTTHKFFEEQMAKSKKNLYACSPFRQYMVVKKVQRGMENGKPVTISDGTDLTKKVDMYDGLSPEGRKQKEHDYACCAQGYIDGMKKVEAAMANFPDGGSVCRDDYVLGLLAGAAANTKCIMPTVLIRRPGCFSLGFMKAFAKDDKLSEFMARNGESISNRDRKLMEDKVKEYDKENGKVSGGAK